MPWSTSPYGQLTAAAAALAPYENWNQRSQAKQQQLLFAQQAAQNAQAEAARFQQQQAAFVEQLEAIRSMDLLGPHRGTWQGMIDDEEEKVANRIFDQYNGDVHKFFQKEGLMAAQNVKRNMLGTQFYRDAVETKANYAQWVADQRAGKMDSYVSFEVYNPTTQKWETKRGTMAEEYAAFLSGNVKKLTYNGGFEPPKDFLEFFSKTPHPQYKEGVPDPKTGRMLPKGVSRGELLAYAMQKGLTPENATAWLDRAFNGKYQDGMLVWKQEQQDSWDARQDAWDRGMDSARLGLDRARLAQGERHHQDRMALERQKQAGAGDNVGLVWRVAEGGYGKISERTGTWGKQGVAREVTLYPSAIQGFNSMITGQQEPNKKDGKITDWGTVPQGTRTVSATGGERELTGNYQLQSVGRNVKIREVPMTGPNGQVLKDPSGNVRTHKQAFVEAYLIGSGDDLTRDRIYDEGMLYDTDVEDYRGEVKPVDGWLGGHDVYRFRTYIPVADAGYGGNDQIGMGNYVENTGIGKKPQMGTYTREAAGSYQEMSDNVTSVVKQRNR